MVFRCLSVWLLLSLRALAANYYVSVTNGNDAADGSISTPWLTITNAIAQVSAGDHVLIQPGIYTNYLDISISGSAGSPITFEGVRGADGSWATIIDPSSPLSNVWEAAVEIGTNVWRATNTAFAARELTIENHRVMRIMNLGLLSDEFVDVTNKTGAFWLEYPSDGEVTRYPTYGAFQFWDGIGAMWCPTNDTIYLRTRDGSDPNSLNIRVAANGSTFSQSPLTYAVDVNDCSYLTFTNLYVRNAYCGFYLWGTNTHHINISSNLVTGGFSRVYMIVGPSDNTILGNTLTCSYYGTAIGGYTNLGPQSTTTEVGSINATVYSISKYWSSSINDTFDRNIYLYLSGNSNLIAYNTITNGIGNGINIAGEVAYPTITNTLCYSNVVGEMPSVGIMLGPCQYNTRVFGNRIGPCDSNTRWHPMDELGETNRLVYFYRNFLFQPANAGDGRHVFMYFENTDPDAYHPTYYCYNNSMSGGGRGLEANERGDESGGATNTFFFNNIINNNPYMYCYTDWDNAALLGAVDYDMIPTNSWDARSVAFLGPNTVTNAGPVWTNTYGMSFAIPSDSLAIDAAIDTTSPFVLNGRNLPAMPDFVSAVGGGLDIGALEYSAPPIVITNRVQYTEDLWLK